MSSQKSEAKSRGVKCRKSCLTVLILFSAVFFAQYSQALEYSLDDLYRITLDRSERVRASEEDVFIAEREKDRARSAFFPVVSAFGSYARFTESKSLAFGSSSFVIQPEDATSWGARLDQVLSLGGREITAYQISKEDIERSRHDLDAVKESQLFSVASSYYEVLRAKKTLDIAKANGERLTKHRDAAVVRLRVGEVTKTDLLRAEAELSGAQSDLVRAENSLRLVKAVLSRVVGIAGDFDVSEPGEKAATGDLTLDALKETAFTERAELKSSSLQKKIAEYRTRVARSAYWPTVSVEGVYLRQDDHPPPAFFIKETIWAGVAVNFPIFEGGLRKAEVSQAEAKYRQSGLHYDDLRKTVGIEVESSYLDYQTQRGVLRSLEDRLKYADDNYRSVSRQYESGLANSIDVIDANTLLLTATRQLADADLNYRLSLLRLQRTTGVLLKTILGEMSGGKK